ncbi:MAG: helix-turn-helix domain-containing protein [Oscillospiraceae bacterium]|jgi:excisionase family DNA binding protein|nr:helix-turn-helix domain-containing protein [Oscillospiraceae bacterium]
MVTERPTSFDDLPLTLRVEELMPILGIGRNTAYELIRSDQIRSVRIGRQLRVPKDAVLDFLVRQNS